MEDEVEQQSVTEQGSFIYGGHLRSTPMVAPLSHPGPFTLAGPRVTIAPTTFHPVPSSSPSSRPPQLLPSPSQISASQLISGLGSWGGPSSETQHGPSTALCRGQAPPEASPRDERASPGTPPPRCLQGILLAGCPHRCLDPVPLVLGAGSCPLAGWQGHQGGGRGRTCPVLTWSTHNL